ncbi:MAG TPA: hypothetical protein VIM29_09935 [Bacillota bacterium]
MDYYQMTKNQTWTQTGMVFLGITLSWVLVSFSLSMMEQAGCVLFELLPIVQCKVLVVAIVFAGRYFLFPQYRLEGKSRWICGLLFLILGGAAMIRVEKMFQWLYCGLVVTDTFLWALVFTMMIETGGALFAYWANAFATAEPGMITGCWQGLWSDAIKLGIWLTFLAGLAFFYLVSFYWLDVIFYSRFLVILFLIIEFSLLGIGYWRSQQKFSSKLALIDCELNLLLKWRNLESGELQGLLPRLHYLLLTREVLSRLSRPVLPLSALIMGLSCGGFLYYLPDLIGIVIKV